MSDWNKLIAMNEIPKLGSRVIRTNDIDIALFRTSDDQVFAIKDQCPHKKGPLSQGIVHGRSVTCPLHNWKIDLITGKAMKPDEGCTNTYPVKVINKMVYLCFSKETVQV